MIWAQDAQGGIGYDNDLLFYVPEDLKMFSKVTRDNIVVMGRNTWDSLPEKFRPLPGRLNIVLSSSVSSLEGAEVYSSFEDVLKKYADDSRTIWVIGGSKVYDSLKDYADGLLITHIHERAVNVDVFAVAEDWVYSNFVVSGRSEKTLSTAGHWFTVVSYDRK